MADEIKNAGEQSPKEEKPKEATPDSEQKPKEEIKPKEEKAASEKPAETPAPPAQSAPQESPKDKAPEKKPRPTECVVCNKSIKKMWYYREGNYYCSKGCWQKSKKSAKEEAAKEEKK